MRTLLLGMGNPILSDDAVGVRLAADFKAVATSAPGLDIVEECSVGGLNLLELLHGYQRAIVLDSVQTSPSKPGAWHRFTAQDLSETIHLTNVHEANFATALDLGRRVGLPLPSPDQIHILAVEIQDNRTFSSQMTPVLERAYPSLKAAIFRELNRLLQEGKAEGRRQKAENRPTAPELPQDSAFRTPHSDFRAFRTPHS